MKSLRKKREGSTKSLPRHYRVASKAGLNIRYADLTLGEALCSATGGEASSHQNIGIS